VKKIVRWWDKRLIKTIFSVVYGSNPPLVYPPSTEQQPPSRPSAFPMPVTAPAEDISSLSEGFPTLPASLSIPTSILSPPGPGVLPPASASTPTLSPPARILRATRTTRHSLPAPSMHHDTPPLPDASTPASTSVPRAVIRRPALSTTTSMQTTSASPGPRVGAIGSSLRQPRAGISSAQAAPSSERGAVSSRQARPSAPAATRQPPHHPHRQRREGAVPTANSSRIVNQSHLNTPPARSRPNAPPSRPDSDALQSRKRRRVQEPPHDPAAKAPGQAFSSITPVSSHTPHAGPTTPPSPSTLDQIDLELVRYPPSVPSRASGTNPQGVNVVFNILLRNIFNNPDILIKAVELLSKISSKTITTIDIDTIPSALAVSGNTMFPNLIEASGRASAHLKDAERTIAATRLKTIMSYVIIFLTLEHAIVPRLREENPGRSVAAERYKHFAEMLNTFDTSLEMNASIVRSHATYGKCYWEYGQRLGIASLLIFAVSDHGLTKIAKDGKNGISELATTLSASGNWWAFAHSIGPPAFRTLFGPRDIEYPVPQLLAMIRSEPVTLSTISALNEAYRNTDSEVNLRPEETAAGHGQPPLLTASGDMDHRAGNWQITIGNEVLPVHRHPTAILSDQVFKRNLGVWLNNTPGDEIVEDGDGKSTPFEAFKTLLPPGNISKELVNFFSRLYNGRRIPGRFALPYGALTTSNGDFQEFLQPFTIDGNQPEKIIWPIDLESSTIGLAIVPRDSLAVVYNWTTDVTLGEGILKVCGCIVCSLSLLEVV